MTSLLCNKNPIYILQEKELCGLSPNFHIHVSVGDLYIPRIGPHIFLQKNRSWGYINRSQPHECGNRDLGLRPRNSFSGIFVSNFRYCVFAVLGEMFGKRRNGEGVKVGREGGEEGGMGCEAKARNIPINRSRQDRHLSHFLSPVTLLQAVTCSQDPVCLSAVNWVPAVTSY